MPSSSQFSDYYYIRFKAFAVVNGRKLDVSTFVVDYSLDQIPTASITLPVGRRADSQQLNEVFEGMDILSGLAPYVPIQLFVDLKAEPDGRGAPDGKPLGFKGGVQMIFDGFLSNPSQAKSRGDASLQLDAFGAVGALAGGTTYTTGMVLTNYANGDGPGVVRLHTGSNNAGDIYGAMRGATTGISSDLWGGGIQPAMQRLLSQVDAWANKSQSFAQLALNRISSPMKLNMSGTSGANLPRGFDLNLTKTLADQFYAVWAGDSTNRGDLWSILMSLKDQFHFHFVPGVTRDYVAPVTPDLSGTGSEDNTLDPDEYFWIKNPFSPAYDPHFYTYVTQVGLMARNYAVSDFQKQPATARTIGKADVIDKMNKQSNGARGRLVLLDAPEWLMLRGAAPRFSLNPGGGVPDLGDLRITTPASTQGADENKFYSSNLGNFVAETILHEMIFAHRACSIATRFRLDQSPGNTMQINTVGEKFTGRESTLFGCVYSVRLEAGVQNGEGYARTLLSYSHIRSEDDQKFIAVPAHPLFNQRWLNVELE